MPTEPPPRIWALLGPHRGDNNQVLALARALGLPFEEKIPSATTSCGAFQPCWLGPTFRSVRAESRAQLQGDPPGPHHFDRPAERAGGARTRASLAAAKCARCTSASRGSRRVTSTWWCPRLNIRCPTRERPPHSIRSHAPRGSIGRAVGSEPAGCLPAAPPTPACWGADALLAGADRRSDRRNSAPSDGCPIRWRLDPGGRKPEDPDRAALGGREKPSKPHPWRSCSSPATAPQPTPH